MARYLMHLAFNADDGRWLLRHDDELIETFDCQADAEKGAHVLGKRIASEGQDAALFVRDVMGFEEERRFDPERLPGLIGAPPPAPTLAHAEMLAPLTGLVAALIGSSTPE